MKNLITFITICVVTATTAFAQNQKYIDAMTKAMHEMDTLQTTDQFLSIANKFERIALAERTEWLPYYYAALARVTSQYVAKDYTKTDEILDVAQKHINIADSLSPNNSEIILIKSMILGSRIMVDPMTRGQQFGMQSMMLMSLAMQADPTNPRPHYIMGQSLFYTPPQFGGGVDKACSSFATAKEKYATFKPASDLHPNWGEDQLDNAMKNCPATTDPNSGKQE